MHRKKRQKKPVKLESSKSPVISADVPFTESISPVASTNTVAPGRQNNEGQERMAVSPVVVHKQSYFSYWGEYLSSASRQALEYASSAAGSLTSLALEQVTNQISRVAAVVYDYSSKSMANATEVTRYLLDPTVFPDDLNQSVDLSATLGTDEKEKAQVAIESVPRPLSAAEQGLSKAVVSKLSTLPIEPVETSVLVVPQPQRTDPNIYDLLGIDSTVKFSELKNVYHNAARQHHPRTLVGGASKETDEFWKQIQSLWSEVNSEEKKVFYDKQLEANRIEGSQERLQITEGPIEQPKLAVANIIIDQERPLPSPIVVEIAPSPAPKATKPKVTKPNAKKADLNAREEVARNVVVKAEAQDLEKLHSTYPHSLKQVGPIEPVIMQKPTGTEIVREAAVKDPVIKALEGYINTRQTQNEYIGWGGRLTGTSKTVKVAAAQALLDYLNEPDKTKHFQPTQEQYNALIEPFSKLKDTADKVLREIGRNMKLTIIAQPEKRSILGIKETLSRLKQRVSAALENKIKGTSNHK